MKAFQANFLKCGEVSKRHCGPQLAVQRGLFGLRPGTCSTASEQSNEANRWFLH